MADKVALITGGANGIGLTVAKALSAREEWTIHIIDINDQAGKQAEADLPGTTFHHADITNYTELSNAFQNAFEATGQLDFVFANAGIFEKGDFYSPKPAEDGVVAPPPEPETLTLDLNLKGATLTAYLAQYYFRCSPHKGRGANLVLTASCAAFYETPMFPLYGSSKYGVLGLMRSLSKNLRLEGIHVNAICPAMIRTGLIDPKLLAVFPQRFVKVERVAETVIQLVDGGEKKGQGITDARGRYVPAARLFGLAVEISDNGDQFFREQHDFCDEGMQVVFGLVQLKERVEAVVTSERSNGAR